jgi:enoyl-CoA hydratase/carnithine racemase
VADLEVSHDGPVEHWTLTRPARRNALGVELVAALMAAAAGARSRRSRVVVLRGDGPVFCAGSDLKELRELDVDGQMAHEAHWPELRFAISDLPQVTVAAIHGAALGGGLVLASFADVIVAEADAVLGLPEVSLGWLPPGGIEALVALAGARQVRELMLTGRRLTGGEAASIGIVHRAPAAGTLATEVDALAADLARLPSVGVAAVKRYWRRRGQPGRQAEADLDALAHELYGECLRAAAGSPVDLRSA